MEVVTYLEKEGYYNKVLELFENTSERNHIGMQAIITTIGRNRCSQTNQGQEFIECVKVCCSCCRGGDGLAQYQLASCYEYGHENMKKRGYGT